MGKEGKEIKGEADGGFDLGGLLGSLGISADDLKEIGELLANGGSPAKGKKPAKGKPAVKVEVKEESLADALKGMVGEIGGVKELIAPMVVPIIDGVADAVVKSRLIERIAKAEWLYYQELQKAGFTQEQAWQLLTRVADGITKIDPSSLAKLGSP